MYYLEAVELFYTCSCQVLEAKVKSLRTLPSQNQLQKRGIIQYGPVPSISCASSPMLSPSNMLIPFISSSATTGTDLSSLWRARRRILYRVLNFWSQPLLNSGQGSDEYCGSCCQICCALIRRSSPLVLPPSCSICCCQQNRRFSRSGHCPERSLERAVFVDVWIASNRLERDSETVDWLIVWLYWAWNHAMHALWEGRGRCWIAQARRASRCERVIRCFRGISGIGSYK